MSEMENNKINEEQLDNVAGGNEGRGEGTYSAYDITPRWIRVTASELNARYWPNGEVAKVYVKKILHHMRRSTAVGGLIFNPYDAKHSMAIAKFLIEQ